MGIKRERTELGELFLFAMAFLLFFLTFLYFLLILYTITLLLLLLYLLFYNEMITVRKVVRVHLTTTFWAQCGPPSCH